jgi:hypothetical protein
MDYLLGLFSSSTIFQVRARWITSQSILSMLVFSLAVAVSTFGQWTVRRYNNTHCTYGVNLQHEGSISELHWAKFFVNNNTSALLSVWDGLFSMVPG